MVNNNNTRNGLGEILFSGERILASQTNCTHVQNMEYSDVENVLFDKYNFVVHSVHVRMRNIYFLPLSSQFRLRSRWATN